jgi:hypothetical protein
MIDSSIRLQSLKAELSNFGQHGSQDNLSTETEFVQEILKAIMNNHKSSTNILYIQIFILYIIIISIWVYVQLHR